MALRIVSLLLALVFARSVVVQANDPDPLVWMTVYVLATARSIAAFLDRLPAVLPKTAALIFGLGLAFRITDHHGNAGDRGGPGSLGPSDLPSLGGRSQPRRPAW